MRCLARGGWAPAARATPSDSGYERVWVGERQHRVHRLVLLAHVGPPPSRRHHGAHLNGDKADNRLDNLAWKTPRQNEADKRVCGTAPRGGPVRRVRPRVRALVRAAVLRGESLSSAARRFGVHRKTAAKYAGRAA